MTLCLISSEDCAMAVPKVGKAADAGVFVFTGGLTYGDGLTRC